ncbi:MAG: class I SAM-dependent methyltransferase [Chloroflexi bacterium]|nr:class I SAM-dependent methyltransferase [Chloroflexota bacterium]
MTPNKGLALAELFDFLIQEAVAHFAGWDFSYLDWRKVDAPLSWSYVSEVLPRVRKAASLLDIGTGGGEMLARFAPFPPETYATESYPPNILIARERLEPLGVKVVEMGNEDKRTPFENDFFDLILNRHSYYWPPELYRIMQPGGIFITQHVGDRNDVDIRALLGAPDDSVDGAWNLTKAIGDLRRAGFRIIEQKEDIYPSRFYDVGAIVYQLKAVPWQIPDFSVEKYFERLKEVHEMIQREGYMEVLEHRFFIVAEKVGDGSR